MEKRCELVDLLKGIGIISIILGHSACVLSIGNINLELGRFVYLYHIMIFFFTAGFVYNEKYNENISLFIGKRFYGIFTRFALYNALFVLIHNFLKSSSLITADPYSFNEIIILLSNGLALNTNETLLGTFWFLPVLFLSCVLLGVSFRISSVVSQHLSYPKNLSSFLLIIIILLFATLGIYTTKGNIFLPYHTQTAFLAVPITFLGFVIKRNYHKIERFICLTGCVISCVILYLLALYDITPICLDVNRIGSPILFYPVTLLGIYFCLCLAKVLDTSFFSKIKIKEIVIFTGKNSFYFMALHFLMFKIIDKIISLFNGDPESIVSVFPHSYNIGLTYAVVTVAVVNIAIYLSKKMARYFKHKIQFSSDIQKNENIDKA